MNDNELDGLCNQWEASKRGECPHPFPRFDEGYAVTPVYGVKHHDLDGLLAAIRRLTAERDAALNEIAEMDENLLSQRD